MESCRNATITVGVIKVTTAIPVWGSGKVSICRDHIAEVLLVQGMVELAASTSTLILESDCRTIDVTRFVMLISIMGIKGGLEYVPFPMLLLTYVPSCKIIQRLQGCILKTQYSHATFSATPTFCANPRV